MEQTEGFEPGYPGFADQGFNRQVSRLTVKINENLQRLNRVPDFVILTSRIRGLQPNYHEPGAWASRLGAVKFEKQ